MKSHIHVLTTTLSLAALMALGSAFAQPHSDHGHAQAQATSAAANDLTDGEVRRIDAAAGKVTIKHGEIKSLDMPPMTMVFTAAEPGLLNNLKVGDKIRFVVEQQQGKMVVTRIVPAS
ncbi:MAG: copper-binding protein [Comamonadaceae bacterium]|nr:copper-binding protein [Comamonadaceae bacterium]